MVESYISPADLTLGEQEIAKGSWVLVTKATDEIWKDIKKGESTGYSMEDTAETIEKQTEQKPITKTSHAEDEVKGFFDVVKSFFTEGEVRDHYENSQKQRNLWAVWGWHGRYIL